MEFYYSKEYQPLTALIQSKFFHELVTLFREADQPPILRALKQQFPEAGFEKKLDQLIDAGIIQRKDRRYTLNFPVYTEQLQKKLLLKHTEFITSYKEWTTRKQQLLFASFTFSEKQHPYFYGCEDGVQQIFADKSEHSDFLLLSFSFQEWANNMGAFFRANQRLEAKPALKKANELLGDVDPVYYLDQVSVIFERLQKNRKIRSSIFLESLYLFGILGNKEQPAFTVPVISQAELVKFMEEDQLPLSDLEEFEKNTLLAALMPENQQSSANLLILKEN